MLHTRAPRSPSGFYAGRQFKLIQIIFKKHCGCVEFWQYNFERIIFLIFKKECTQQKKEGKNSIREFSLIVLTG